jgi:ABC-2 type transport system permease protein
VATVFGLVALVLLAASTIVSSLLIVGHGPLTGLSGQTIAPSHALALVSASWAAMALPMIGFTCLALLFSIWSRNGAVGIAAPVVIGLVMQLIGALGGIETLRPYLLSTPFEAWHGLLASPRFTGPLLEGVITSAGWSVVCLVAAFLIMRRRDITGG